MTIAALTAFTGSLIFAFAVIWAGLTDLTEMKIRNELILLLLASYAALAPLSGFDLSAIGSGVLAALGILAVMFFCFAMGWVGGGDAKLIPVVALWIGADQAFAYILCTAVFGGLLTLGILRFRASPLPSACLDVPWIQRLHAANTGIPYGVAIATAAIAIFPHTPWVMPLA